MNIIRNNIGLDISERPPWTQLAMFTRLPLMGLCYYHPCCFEAFKKIEPLLLVCFEPLCPGSKLYLKYTLVHSMMPRERSILRNSPSGGCYKGALVVISLSLGLFLYPHHIVVPGPPQSIIRLSHEIT